MDITIGKILLLLRLANNICLQTDVQLRCFPPKYDEVMFVLWYLEKSGMCPSGSMVTEKYP